MTQTFPDTVFRAYDIRGIIGEEITPEFMNNLGRAIMAVTGETNAVVGFDARPSSAEFAPHLIAGMVSQGATVRNLGMTPSEVVIATAALNNISIAAIVTASHNPAEYVGVKMFVYGSTPILANNGLNEIKAMMQTETFPEATKAGQVLPHDPWPAYSDYLKTTLKLQPLQRRNVLADAGNGTGGLLMHHLAPLYNLEVEAMYFEPDGTYPNHVPNPIIPGARAEAEAKAKAGTYDLTLLFDGDADRIVFLDETGNYIPSDFTGTLIAEHIMQKLYPGSSIVIDPRRGWTTQDSAKTHGYKTIITKAGSPFVKAGMREHNAPFGYEASAHNFYKDFFYSDSAGLTLGYVLQIMETTGKPLSELIAPYRQNHCMIDETNYVHEDKDAAFAALTQEFADGKISHMDGLSIDYSDWHANLRASNTEPLIRLNLEARDPKVLQEKFSQVHETILRSGGHPQDH